MAAYIHHAAYYTGKLDWTVAFFREVFRMDVQKQRTNPDGLREIWLEGGLQLCETQTPQDADGRAAHLCLIVDDLEAARTAALERGCAPMAKHHWVRLPEGLSIEMFPAADGAIAALSAMSLRK